MAEHPKRQRNPKTDKGLLRAEQQRLQALQLRQAGATYTQIGQELGCTRQHAFYLVSTALARIKSRTEETAEQMLALDLGRLDAMLLGIYRTALSGNLFAIDRVLKILERRARLAGLDAPSKVAPTTPDGQAAWQPEQAPDNFYHDILSILTEHGGLPANGATPDASA
jgi:hypothetical protein